MKKPNELLGSISAIGTMILIAVIAWKMHAFDMVLHGLGLLLTGNVMEIAPFKGNFLDMSTQLLAVIAIELPCSIAAALVVWAIVGKTEGDHFKLRDLFGTKDTSLFFGFFVLCGAEELLARGLFLGLIAKLPFLSGTVPFYVLAVLGNGIWALIHLKNFSKKKDRKWIRTLPQFVGGIALTYVFVKFGLLACILAHFGSNAIIFSLDKMQKIDRIDGMILGYALVCAGVSYMSMSKPLGDISAWFAEQPVFRLPGWGFWDYVKVSIFVPSCFSVIFGLLMYDRGEAGKKQEGMLGTLIGAPIVIGILYLLFLLLGIGMHSVQYRILILAILVSFAHTGSSGSSLARVFWYYLPDAYVTICILGALGFWSAMAWIAIESLVYLPSRILIRYDS